MKAKEEGAKVRQMPKGGRKGGTSFPRVSLNDALGYAKKLVTKTHSGPQPLDVVYAGVVGAKSGTGNVRIGALKQYGLMKGDAKSDYVALDLAKKISAAPLDEMQPLLQRAALHPSVFKRIYEAFQGDTVTKAKLRQRAADLNVHPEETGTCVDLYVSALLTAGLAGIDGESVTHAAAGQTARAEAVGVQQVADEPANRDQTDDAVNGTAPDENENDRTGENRDGRDDGTPAAGRSPRAVFNVNVTLDSSLDTEKLEKQLQLLKRYGAL